MATLGPKIRFTPEEKLEFNPHFVNFLQHKATLESIQLALGCKAKYSRFELYKDALCDLIQLRKDKKTLSELTTAATLMQNKSILTQSIKQRNTAISTSREAAVESAITCALRI